MITFLIIIIANAFEIIGFHRACQWENDANMIFGGFGRWSEKVFGKFWSKPIYSCPTCCASLHGIFPFWITYISLYSFDPMAIAYWIFYTLTLAGVATFINER